MPDQPKVDLKKLIEQLRLAQQGEGTPAEQHKPIEEYKFWKTQPVTKFEKESAPEQGPLEVKQVSDVPKTPQNLPAGFKWATLDVTNTDELTELYELLYANYVEDDDEQFRFKYSIPFLRWALTPPGWNKEFAVAVRATDTNKLLAFISGTPAKLSVRGEVLSTVEINFLCVHKQLRSKRMAPVLIREVTRRVNLTGVWQALFTAGTLIPTPVSEALYFHRVLNWSKLYDVGFAGLPPGSTPAQEVARCALPSKQSLKGFRPLNPETDLDQVHALLSKYLSKFELHQQFSKEELVHWLTPRDKVLHSFVVESESGEITDFISEFGLESSVFGTTKHDSISIAYTFYYATTAAKPFLRTRLEDLFQALLIECKQLGYDVLNALTVMDNTLVLDATRFRPGDGVLHYNLFNWKTAPISGGIDDQRRITPPGGVGVVML